MNQTVILNFLHKNSLEINELNIKLIEKIFSNLSNEELYYTLMPNISSLFSPFQIDGMEKSCRRLINGLKNNENILIFGDKDADGMIGTTILKDFLENFKKTLNSQSKIIFDLPEGEESYGISEKIVEKYKDEVKLIITVDNGISATEAVKKAKDLNIDTIITDHHELHDEEIFKYSYSIVNPKIKKAEGSYLSGAGVAFMLVLGTLILHYKKIPILHFLEENNGEIEISKILSPELEKTKVPQKKINELSLKESFLFIDEVHFKKTIEKVPNAIALVKDFFYLTKIYSLFSKNNKNFKEICDEFEIPEFLKESQKVEKVLLSTYLKYDPIISKAFNKYSPLVGLTVLSDNMPFIHYNKFFIQKVIENISKTQMMGLNYLISNKVGKKDKLSISELVMKIIPTINSAGRMGEGSKIVKLITSNNISEINKLFEEIEYMDEERKKLVSQWSEKIHELSKNQKVIVSSLIHKGIISLISTRISNTVDHPIVIITNGGSNNGIYSGSARFRKGDIFSIIKSLADYFENFGGHKKAAGFVIQEDKIEEFKEAFEKIDYTKYYDRYEPIMKISISDFYDKFGKLLSKIEPLNQEMKPLFEDLTVIEDYRKNLYNNYCQVKIQNIWIKTDYTEERIKKYMGKKIKIIYSYEFVMSNSLKEEVFIPKILEIE
ncbi:MAG: DHH family phosphoesterase [Brevinematia bacterium]